MIARRPWLAALLRAIAAGAIVCAALGPVAAAGAAESALAIRHGGAWREWWRAGHAPERWSAPETLLTTALAWRRLAPGVEWTETELAGSAPAWRTRLVVVRIDPAAVRLSLTMDLAAADGRPAWTIERAPARALVALNAGQFVRTMPWGWLVQRGRQRLAPGLGPLSTALAVDSAGRLSWLEPEALARPPGGIVEAFQSYPTLLHRDGRVPRELREDGRGVDRTHRDARLALGGTRDGRLLVVMTRFAALGAAAETVPIGPTTPEMAAIMGALGAADAMMIDGGISAQMVLRDPGSNRRWRWRGWRKVPLALIVEPRS